MTLFHDSEWRRSRATLGALALLIIALYVLQYWTLPKYSVIPRAFTSFGLFWKYINFHLEPGWADAAILAVVAGSFAVLVALEIRHSEVTRLLHRCFRSKRATWSLLVVSTLVISRSYFASGEANWSGDGSAHLAYIYAAAHCIAAGEIPIWTNQIGLGSPYLQYYGFLYFYLVGFLDLIVGELFTTIKISLALSHIASALGMYLLVRTAARSRAAGFLGALIYALCFWHLQQVLLMGRFPLSLFYALLPWPFYFFERVRLPNQRVPAVCGGALTLGLLPFVHPGYGFWATLFFSLYAGLRLVFSPRLGHRATWIATGLMGLSAILFGAYLTLPMWLERAGTGLDSGVILSNVPDPSWKRVFVWSNLVFPLLPLSAREGNWYGGYLGTVPTVLALIGGVLPWRYREFRRHGPQLAAALCLALTLLLVFAYRWPPLQALPIVTAFNAGRYLLFTTFFLSFLAGMGGAALKRWQRTNPRLTTLSLPLLLLVADLGPTTIQQPYQFPGTSMTPYSDELIEELPKPGQNLSDGELPNFRLFTNMDQMHPFLATSRLLYRTGLPTPQAEHRLIMDNMHAFAAPFERYLNSLITQADSPDPIRSHLVQSGLQLLNINYVTSVNSRTKEVILNHLETGPALVSSRLENLEPLAAQTGEQARSELIKAYIEAMNIDLVKKRSARFFISDLGPSRDLGTKPNLEVHSHRVWHQRVELDLQVDAHCYLRLAYTYFPWFEIRINDQPATAMKTAAGFICLPLEPGPSRITIRARLSPLRQMLLALDCVLLTLGIGALYWTHRKRRSLSH